MDVSPFDSANVLLKIKQRIPPTLPDFIVFYYFPKYEGRQVHFHIMDVTKQMI